MRWRSGKGIFVAPSESGSITRMIQHYRRNKLMQWTIVAGSLLAFVALLSWSGGEESAMAQDAAVRMISVEGEGARYWPRWRGPSGQGLVSGTGYVDTWSATSNVVWKTRLPGNGNSSPIVWG